MLKGKEGIMTILAILVIITAFSAGLCCRYRFNGKERKGKDGIDDPRDLPCISTNLLLTCTECGKESLHYVERKGK